MWDLCKFVMSIIKLTDLHGTIGVLDLIVKALWPAAL